MDDILATLSVGDDEREMMKTQIQTQFGKSSKLKITGKKTNPFKVTLSGSNEFKIKTKGIDASDGNCLFLAMIWQLYTPGDVNSVYEASFIREVTVTHIKENLEHFRHLIEERIGKGSSSESVTNFVFHTLSLPSTYGGRESLIAMSAHFKINILVFTKNKLEFIPEFNTAYTRTACLVNKTPEKENEIHFDSAIKIL